MPVLPRLRAALRPLATVVFVTALCSCAAPPLSAPAETEESVDPGINDAYRNPDVTTWVERFEREGREIFDRRDEIVAACGIRPGSRLADVGAGTGLFVPLFSEAVGPAGIVYAVDIVPEFIEHMRTKAARQGLGNVRAVLCTERSVELEPGSIDLAFICDAYHHFEYPRSTMSSIHRALRAGGELVLIDFERVPGESSAWVIGHVRAGKERVRSEIERMGFEFVEEVDLLKSNYVLRFRAR